MVQILPLQRDQSWPLGRDLSALRRLGDWFRSSELTAHLEHGARVFALCGLTAVGTAAIAQPVTSAPNFNRAEKVAFALVEQSLGIIAASVDRFGCIVGTYDFFGAAFADGTGALVFDDVALEATSVDDARGTLVNTMPYGGPGADGEIGDVIVGLVDGFYAYSKASEISYGTGDFTLNGEPHDLHVIKDWYLGTVFGGLDGIIDKGLTVTTKSDYPRGKWRQASQYLRPNGSLGLLQVNKTRVAPDGAANCTIRIRACAIDHYGGDNLQIIDCFVEVR